MSEIWTIICDESGEGGSLARYLAAVPDFVVDRYDSPQEFSSQLYRSPGAVGLMISTGDAGRTAGYVQAWRDAGLTSLLMCLTPFWMPSVLAVDRIARQDAVVALLRAGADDVQHGFIEFREIATRLRALDRRIRGGSTTVTYGPLEYDADWRILRNKGIGREVELTPAEAGIFEKLLARQGKPVLRAYFYGCLPRGTDSLTHYNTVTVLVSRLRKKMKTVLPRRKVILSESGVGYMLVAESEVFPKAAKRLAGEMAHV